MISRRTPSGTWIAFALVAALGFASATRATAQETDYFRDVASTHVLTDAVAQILDIDLGDVDGGGDLDKGAIEFGRTRSG